MLNFNYTEKMKIYYRKKTRKNCVIKTDTLYLF
jgi:hypothetical protein